MIFLGRNTISPIPNTVFPWQIIVFLGRNTISRVRIIVFPGWIIMFPGGFIISPRPKEKGGTGMSGCRL